MDKRVFLIAGASIAMLSVPPAGCTTAGAAAGDPGARRRAINVDAGYALGMLTGLFPPRRR